MNKNDFKENIKISDRLDEYVLNGIEKGRMEKQIIKNSRKLGAVTKVAGVLVADTIVIGVVNPEIIRAMPVIGSVLAGFESSNFGMPTDKFVKYSQGTELVAENKKAKWTRCRLYFSES